MAEPEIEQHPERHEHRDADVQRVATLGFVLLITVGVAMLVVLGLLTYLGSKATGPPVGPLAETRIIPPGPLLQVTPAQDLEKLRAHEDAVLNSYGWADRNAGVVRIPISRAMDLLAQRGLPVHNQNTEAKK